ncbi:MAG: shikimate kinase [Bacteroidota bacterium]
MSRSLLPLPPNLPERIYLIGMMGVGKSTLGKQLANALGYSFIDTDKQIAFIEGRSIQQIFDEEGESYFREAEHHILHQTAIEENTVIATGGGTPCFFDNIEWINRHGKSIYLEANPAFIISRVGHNTDKRPLLKGKQNSELEPFIIQILAEREPYYSKAHLRLRLPVKSFPLSILSML